MEEKQLFLQRNQELLDKVRGWLFRLSYDENKTHNTLENYMIDSGSLLCPGGKGGVREQSAAAGATRLQRPE